MATSRTESTEAFPPLSPGTSQSTPTPPANASSIASTTQPTTRRPRTSSAAASIRSAASKVIDADLPPGFLAATGVAASKAPTLADIRRGSVGDPRDRTSSDESRAGRRRFSSNTSRKGASGTTSPDPFPPLAEVDTPMPPLGEKDTLAQQDLDPKPTTSTSTSPNQSPHEPWIQPPPLSWGQSFTVAMRTYARWVITLPGFLITIYGLNVVAWGGMLFLLLCNAAPAMCTPTCDDINSPRRIWIEIDSQILNALFCVTGFGLAPWRFRDLWFWFIWAFGRSPESKKNAERRLAGVHRSWYRLRGSDALPVPLSNDALDETNPALPLPLIKTPAAPLTTHRAPPTKPWKLTYVIHMNIWNTFFQCVLSGFMWGLNRYDRPSWSTGLFVALACIVAALGGLMMFQEGKKVKNIEGFEIGRVERKVRGMPHGADDMETGVSEAAGRVAEKEKREGTGMKVRRAFAKPGA